MAHIVMMIAPEAFRDEELTVPRDLFQKHGHTVTTVSTRTGPAIGMLGHTETITQTLDDLLSTDPQLTTVDTLVVVGGMGAIDHLWHNTQLHTALQTLHQTKKPIAAICLSPATLAFAGLLTGKQATVWDAPPAREAFATHHTTFTNQPVTTDTSSPQAPIITANGPDAAHDFALALLTHLPAYVAK